MPKQLKDYLTFHGGINSETSSFDIDDKELVLNQNWSVASPGQIHTQKQPATRANSLALTADDEGKGYGLLPIKSDVVINAGDRDTNYIVVCKDTGVVVAIASVTNDYDTARTVVSLHSSGSHTTVKGIATYQDGVLRISDSSKTALCRVKCFEYIDRGFFASGSAHNTITAWKANDVELTAPSSSSESDWLTKGENVIDYRSTSIRYATTDGTFDPSIRVSLTKSGDADLDGKWEGTDYEFAITHVYQGNQETLPTIMKIIDWVDGDSPELVTELNLPRKEYWKNLQVTVSHSEAQPFPERILGARIYIRKKSKNARWTLLLDIDFVHGVRPNTFDLWDAHAWAQSSANVAYYSTPVIDIKSPCPQTYLSINGFMYDEYYISFPATDTFQYSAAAIVNRRLWIANAKYYDENGSAATMGDRLFYTPPNKLDTFPTSFYLDIGMNDGESFTALAGFGNRLFCYKQHNLYIVNVEAPMDTDWFIEGNYKSMGVVDQTKVVTTDIGLVWYNQAGCYVWSGSGAPQELTSKISNSDWTTIATSTGTIGYDFDNKQIVIIGKTEAASYAWSFDFRTQGWQTWKDFALANGTTNMITLPDATNDLVFYSGAGLKVYKPRTLGISGAAGDSKFKTKKDDFGSSVLLKKAYNVYMTISSGAGVMDADLTVSTDVDNYDFDVATDGVTNAKVEVIDISNVGNFKWIQLTFQNAATDRTINIEDISIEYRPLLKRAS